MIIGPCWRAMLTASSTASRPKSVVNLMIGFIATDEVSLKGSPHGVADDGRVVERRALLLQLDLDDLLGVVPGAAGVGHEDRLEEAEERDRDQVADEEVRLEEREGRASRRRRTGRC